MTSVTGSGASGSSSGYTMALLPARYTPVLNQTGPRWFRLEVETEGRIAHWLVARILWILWILWTALWNRNIIQWVAVYLEWLLHPRWIYQHIFHPWHALKNIFWSRKASYFEYRQERLYSRLKFRSEGVWNRRGLLLAFIPSLLHSLSEIWLFLCHLLHKSVTFHSYWETPISYTIYLEHVLSVVTVP